MTGGASAAIVARGVGFRYAGRPRRALADVELEVERGECLLVLGPSGSGKSTLALAIAGLVPREFSGDWTGELLVDGADSRSTSPAELSAQVGLVFQDPESQLVMERVEDDVAFGLENRGWEREAMRGRVREALTIAGLAGFERRRTTRLSGGEQQRLALAGVLAPSPSILVLDEPTANLDPAGAAAFIERVADLRRTHGTTVVLIEHRVDLAWPLADRVLALGSDGRPLDLGTPDEVVARSGPRLVREGVWLPRSIEAAVGRESARAGVDAEDGAATGGRGSRGDWPAGTTDPLLAATGVRFGYERGRPILQGVDLSVSAGERVALRGSNGSGKSTLARLLVGLLRPEGGRVRLGDADPTRLPARDLARQAGLVFQDPERQFLGGRVADEVAIGLRVDERAGVSALMDVLGLPLGEFGERSPYALSGGEQRRLSLACALVRHPRLLVLDEPTFGQDRRGVESLLGILRSRVAAGAAVIAATHDERFAGAFADRTLWLQAGRLATVEPDAQRRLDRSPAMAVR